MADCDVSSARMCVVVRKDTPSHQKLQQSNLFFLSSSPKALIFFSIYIKYGIRALSNFSTIKTFKIIPSFLFIFVVVAKFPANTTPTPHSTHSWVIFTYFQNFPVVSLESNF